MANVDYWRVCTFADSDYVLLAAWISRFGLGKAARFLQYAGKQIRDTPMFLGKGEQVTKDGEILRHYLCQHSGSESHKTWPELLSRSTNSMYCTRLDLQRTIRDPLRAEDWRPLYDTLPGKKSIVESDTRTIYIGVRTSDSFARLYQKDGGFLRLEFETKGAWSRRFFQRGIDINSVYSFLLTRCALPEQIKALFSLRSDTNDEYAKEVLEHGNERKLAWLQTIAPAILKMGADQDIGEKACAIVEILYQTMLQAKEDRDKNHNTP